MEKREQEIPDVSLTNLMGGLCVERFDDELKRVLNNIYDPNTPATAKRSVTLTVTFKPDKQRDTGKAEIAISAKLSPADKVETRLFFALTKSGPVATEYNPHQPALPGCSPSADGKVVEFKKAGGE